MEPTLSVRGEGDIMLVQRSPDGAATVSVSEIIVAVEARTGLTRGYLDMTGGNCAAIRWDLDGGAHLLVTHGDVFTFSRADRQPYFEGWTAGVYVGDSEPVGIGMTDRTDNDALLDCVISALKADGERTIR
jgi:hypothetical protein